MPRVTRNSTRLASNTTATVESRQTAPSSSSSSAARTRSQVTNEQDDGAPIAVRRSTRRAAMDAKARIAEESKREFERKRRSRRLADAHVSTGLFASSSPVARRQRQQQHSPMENSLDLKPAALPSVGGKQIALKSDENAEDLSQLEEFTCAICLDKPDTLVDLATISGCTHKFCFDCIDKWAETENKCPCCKERFRSIDRVKNLPLSPPPAATTSRRGKRKRDNTNNSGSNTRRRTSVEGDAAEAPAPRVNSRTVEDRTQQSSSGLSVALLETILNSAFMGRRVQFGGVMSRDEAERRGTTTFQFPVPSNPHDDDLRDMAGMLRSILQSASLDTPFTVQAVEFSRLPGGASSRSGPPPPRRRSGASPGSDSRARRQRSSSTLFSYFSGSPHSRASSRSSARPASGSGEVIDLQDSDSE